MPDIATLARRHRHWLAAAGAVLLVALSFYALSRLTHEVRFRQVRAAVHALSPVQIGLALAATAGSYLVLTLYDALALRVIGRPLPWRTAALGSFTSYTLSHNLGLGLLTGGSARYRIYTAAGLTASDVARVIAIAGATFWAGVVTVTGAALLTHHVPLAIAGRTLDPATLHLIGAACLILPTLLLAAGRSARPSWALPRADQAIALLGVALADLALASAALLILLPSATPAMLPAFVLGYALAIIATVITHVPGGVGVFEAVVLAVVPVDRTTLFAALIAYRFIYYLLPLALSLMILAWHEAIRRRVILGLLVDARAMALAVAPPLLAATTFLSGAMMLASGSLPALKSRMGALTAILPLPFVEASHVAASLVGTALLLISPFLYRRLDGALVATRTLLLLAALFSLTKGVDYEEAAVCLSVAALLQVTRPAFYRRTALTGPILSPATLAAIGIVIGAAAWLGFFAYRHVEYSDRLWWEFTVRGDAPRFLRALLASSVMLASAAVWHLMSPVSMNGAASEDASPDPAAIHRILAAADRTEAMLALTGDKRFLLSEEKDAFVMYQVRGASWIVMGDPVGPREAWGDLLWRLRELSDRAQGRLMLYEISAAAVEIAIDLGLNIVKCGQEAVVDLPQFVLETPRLRAVRRSERAAAKKGATFRVVPAAEVPAMLPVLGAVSDEWLRLKSQSEKAFSLGAFRPEYVARFDVAVVTVDDRVVAFANLWLTANRREASVDLMRHSEAAPSGTMDFLFANLIRWAAERGYQRFSLGMAPLSGIEGRRLAPTWAKVGAFVFRHGEKLYGFRGLHTYKEKFAPVWEPRYIAGPQGFALLQALRDVARLISKPRAAERHARTSASARLVFSTIAPARRHAAAALHRDASATPAHAAAAA